MIGSDLVSVNASDALLGRRFAVFLLLYCDARMALRWLVCYPSFLGGLSPAVMSTRGWA